MNKTTNFLTVVFASLFLVSIGMISHNAFADQVVGTIAAAQDLHGVSVNPNTNMVYVRDDCGCGGNSPLVEINGSTNSVQASIGTSPYNGNVAVNPNTNLIYFSNSYPGPNYSVSVLNGSTNALVTSIPVDVYGSGTPGKIAINPNTNKIYVSDGDGFVYVIDGATNAIASKIPAGDGEGIAVNQNTNMIYVSNLGSNSTSVIDGSTNTVVTTVPVGWGPMDIALNPITNKIFVANYWGGTVSVIDGNTNNVITTIQLSHSADSVAVNPTTDKLYISLGNYTVSVINDKTYAVLQDVPLSGAPWQIGINPITDMIYVAEPTSNGNVGPGHVVVIQGDSYSTPTVPSAPQNLQATAGNAQVSLSWSAPSSKGGSPITNYKIYRGTSPASETLLATTGNVTSYTDNTVTNGQQYFYKVTAINSVGESAQSNEANATPKTASRTIEFSSNTPYASFTGTVNASDTVIIDHGVTLTTYGMTNYGDIENNGTLVIHDATVANYATVNNYGGVDLTAGGMISNNGTFNNHSGIEIADDQAGEHIANNAGGTFNNLPGSSMTFPTRTGGYFKGLLNHGTFNNGGLFSDSNEIYNYGVFNNTGTMNLIPGVYGMIPADIANSGVFNNSGTMNLESGPFGTEPAEIANSGKFGNMQPGAISNGGTFANDCGSTYLNRGTFSGNELVYSCAHPPQNLQAMAGNSQVLLSWSAPSNNTGFQFPSYNVYRGPYSGLESLTPIATGITSTTYNDTTVTNGQVYFYKVTDANSTAQSPPSNEASATPSAPVTVPSAPANLSATAVSLSQVNLSWTAPASNGGSAITGYMVERSADSGTTWSTVSSSTGSTTVYNDTGLAASTTYTYRVSAINSVGTSSPSNTASATTSASMPTGIVLGNVQSTSGTVSTSNAITISNFNAGSGSNRLLVVGVSANNNNVASITFGGVPLTARTMSFYNNDAEFWYLKNPTGTGDITVTMGGPTQAVVGAYSFSGVNQTAPIATHVAKHNTTPNSPNISITTKYPNDLVLDLPSIYGGSTLSSPTCPQQWDVNVPNAITGASSSTTVQSPATVTCKWTASSADFWDDVAVELRAN